MYAAVFHLAGIATVGGIHGQHLALQVGRQTGRSRLSGSLRDFCRTEIVCGRGCKRFFGFLQGVERFILGTGIAFGLQLAFRPGVVDAGVTKHHSFPLQESISSNSHQPASLISLRNSRAHISASLPARWCCPQGISNSWQR